MSFEQTTQTLALARTLFEQIFAGLPQIPFNPRWVDAKDQFTPAVEAVGFTCPVVSIDPSNGRRAMFVPTHQFGTIVLYDKWPGRGAMSPLVTAHPHGFDMIDYPFEAMAIPASQVADDFAVTGEGVESEGLTPIFERLLQEVIAGEGEMVRFPEKETWHAHA